MSKNEKTSILGNAPSIKEAYDLLKVIKTRKSFPNDEAALKLIYLAIKNASKKWTMPIQN